MDFRRLRIGEWLAGLGGVALLVAMFVDWYGAVGSSTAVNAWEAFAVIDVFLALTALVGIGLAVVTAMQKAAAIPTSVASVLGSISMLTFALLVYRTLSLPDDWDFLAVGAGPDLGDITREAGLWLGLGACAAVVAGAVAAMKDESFPEAARSNVPVETLQPPEGGRA